MPNTRYHDAYLAARVDSATPIQLVHLAYEGAITSIGEAREYLRSGQIHERSRAITRATQILMELSSALNHSAAPELCLQLSRVYDYAMDRLREANFEQREAPLAEAGELLERVAESWRVLAEGETQAPQVPASITQPPAEVHTWMQPVEPQVSYGSYAYGR